MRHPGRYRLPVVAALLAVLVTACGRGDDASSSAGVTDSTVTIGSSYPFSGPISSFGTESHTMEAYFKYVNAEFGGVKMADGKRRKIEYKVYDDAYTPEKTVANVKRLVEQDQVFAVFGVLGTPGNVAVRDYLNARKVPQIYAATAASQMGFEYEEFPSTIGWQLSYTTEAAIDAAFIESKIPNARVAALVTNNDGALDMYAGFQAAIKGTGIKVVGKELVNADDTTVDAQMTNLARTNADVFFNITTSRVAAQSIVKQVDLGWTPELKIIVGIGSSVEGVMKPAGLENSQGWYTVAFTKDPADPVWAGDKALATYKKVLSKYAPANTNPADILNLQGYALAETLYKTLERSEPNRESLLEAARSLNDVPISVLLPGVTLTTGADDPFPVESAQLQRFTNGSWELKGDIVSFEGKTPEAEAAQ